MYYCLCIVSLLFFVNSPDKTHFAHLSSLISHGHVATCLWLYNQSTQQQKVSRSLFFSDFTVYLVGWPRVLDSRGATSRPPVKLLRHRAGKDLLYRAARAFSSRLALSGRSWWSHHDHGVVILHSFDCCTSYKHWSWWSHHDHGVVILHSFDCWRATSCPMAVCVNMEWTLTTLHWNLSLWVKFYPSCLASLYDPLQS